MKPRKVSLRLPVGLAERVEAIAGAFGVDLSAAIRFALQRGVAALEAEAVAAPLVRPPCEISPLPDPPVSPAPPPRRRVYSPGVR